MGSGARWSLTPRPEYPADGRKIPSVYGEPAELPVQMQQELGTFPSSIFGAPCRDYLDPLDRRLRVEDRFRRRS